VKPLGTITMCFPYVDEYVETSLNSLMKEAKNFGDFVNRLCEYVCSEQSSLLLDYFAFYFSFHISEYNLTDKLEKAGKVPVLAEPLLLIVRYRRGESISWNEMKHSLVRAFRESPNDWISYHFYLKWRYYAQFNFPECDIEVKSLDIIEEGINENKNFEFFRSYLYRLKAIRYMYDFNPKERIKQLNQALLLAKKYDDQIAVADLLAALVNAVKFSDDKRALDLLESSREISERLNYKYNIGHIHQEMGHIMGMRGEFDFSIKHLSEFKKVRESLGLPLTTQNILMALYYIQCRRSDKALEYIEDVIESQETIRKLSAMPIIVRGWALAELRRYADARNELVLGKKLATKSGVAWYRYLWYQLAEGNLEKVEGNYDNAITIYEDVLEFMGDNPMPLIQHICYFNLTEIEIERLDIESLNRPIDSSGHWMHLLDEYVEKNDFPGITAQLLILKAKLYKKQGDTDEVRRLLKGVLRTAKKPSMNYLKNIITSNFSDYSEILFRQ
jgi:hypothetical protein